MGRTAGGEGGKFWMGVLAELRNRRVRNTFIVCCDGLKVYRMRSWPHADIQLCVVRLVRCPCATSRRSTRGRNSRELREICTAPTAEAAEARFDRVRRDLAGPLLPSHDPHWEQSWGDFVPFLEFPVELRTLVYMTTPSRA